MPTVNYTFHYSIFINSFLSRVYWTTIIDVAKKIIGNNAFYIGQVIKNNNTDSTTSTARTEAMAAILMYSSFSIFSYKDIKNLMCLKYILRIICNIIL